MIVAARQSVCIVVAGGSHFRGLAGFFGPLSRLSSIAFDIHLEDGGVVDQPVDSRQGHSRIREDRVPRTKGLVGCDQHGSPFISGADQFEQHAGLGLILCDLAAIIHRGRIFALVRAARGAHDLHAQPEFSPQG